MPDKHMVLGSNPSGGTGRLLPKPTPVETDWDVKTRVLWRPVYLAPVVAGYDCSWRPWLVSETQAASYSAGGGAGGGGGVGKRRQSSERWSSPHLKVTKRSRAMTVSRGGARGFVEFSP